LINLWIIGHTVEKATSSAVNKKILLIFAKQPEAGSVKTRLCPPFTPDEAARVYEAMLYDVLESTADLPDIERWLCYGPSPTAAAYFHRVAPRLYQLPQQGTDLGERLINAIETAFSRGAYQVAVIGTDAPDLPSAVIDQAFSLLSAGTADAVFGPTTDGGYYLLGMTRLWKELLTDIPWSTDAVLQVSLERAKTAAIRTVLLGTWHDLDTAEDLEQLGICLDSAAPRTRDRLWEIGCSIQRITTTT
jgi:uncharacterized protein